MFTSFQQKLGWNSQRQTQQENDAVKKDTSKTTKLKVALFLIGLLAIGEGIGCYFGREWLSNHQAIAIPVGSVVAAIHVGGALGIIYKLHTQAKKDKQEEKPTDFGRVEELQDDILAQTHASFEQY